MDGLDLATLRTFLELAQTGSFSRTATRVHRTQSAVSAQIRRLEELLGVRLFARTTRRVALTPEGERLLPHARAVVEAAAALLARFRDGEVEGDVRLGCPEDVAGEDLPAILAHFVAAHPRVRLHVRCDLTLHLVEQFEAGAFDLVLIKLDPQQVLPGARLLRPEPLAWVGATPSPAPPEDQPVPLVLAPAPCVYRARAVEALAAAGCWPDVVYASPSEAGQIAAVRAGLGVTVLPRRRVPADLAILGPGWPALRPAAIGLLATARPTAAIEAFARFAEARLSEEGARASSVSSVVAAWPQPRARS
ncbi:MAG: LysR family transcriptional regulator [Sphingomonadaceae bacterium]|uniref:LysR family transcriptional regulator n=1 Tax=Thermaurantiacus sp. TaxID=2820283 RepID=UPI00298EF877|nr:LysR family transcriptional regulator [Thermaurantiacus sp.]MCS6986025.1 LysR family transcriptional regulator [Sphingomonadaceae bacterium]MDW8414759.1 LysR family transcriptional regulator [Thermaurantiacus sp.]